MSDRNKKIDLLRLVFCIMIVVYHCNKLVGKSVYFAKGWYIAIEFFAIVSGIFLMSSMEKKLEMSCIFWKKWKGIYSVYLISYFFAFFLIQIVDHTGLKKSIKLLYRSVGNIFLFEMRGMDIFNGYCLQGSWYISAMLWSILLIFFIFIISGKWFSQVIAPLLVILFIGYFNKTYGRIHRTHDWNFIFYSGTIRIAAELLLGCICYKIGQILRRKYRKYKRILEKMEILLYITVIVASYFYSNSSYDFIYLVLLAIAITITFSFGEVSKNFLVLNKISQKGERISLLVYLNHLWLLYIVKKLEFSMTVKILLFLFSLLISCLLIHNIDKTVYKVIEKYKLYRKAILLKEK